MRRITRGNVIFYAFESLANCDSLVHAVSTRHGGASPAPFDTLNLSHTAGDDESNVADNIARLHGALGLDARSTVSASQAQADRVAVVNRDQCGTIVRDVDALLTNQTGIPLMLRYADCVPIVLFDPVHTAVGVVHSGWRGTVAKIASKAVKAMTQAFGTQPRDLIAGIAPSIGPCCYRVGPKVASRARQAFETYDDVLVQQADGSVHFDLWKANARQLSDLGVSEVEVAGICTAHRSDEFYSWRADNGKTGRFGAIVCLV